MNSRTLQQKNSGRSTLVYEKGKEVYEKIAPHLNRVGKELNNAFDELSVKGEEILNKKNKEKEEQE